MENQRIFEVSDLTCGYGKNIICDQLSMTLEQGKCYLILGKNGCGKSTFFSTLVGIRKMRQGKISWKGQEISVRELQKHVGYVPQTNPLIPELSVWDNLLLWYQDKAELKRRLKDGMLFDLGLSQVMNMTVNKLSGGMARRCAIGCAMARDPELLILDEPDAALDLECKKIWKQCMKTYVHQGGTILFSSHDESDFTVADAIFRMENGKLVREGD